MKKRIARKVRTVSLALICVLLLSACILFIMFHNEILTVSSIKQINSFPVYEMNYHGGYSFDKYLASGSKDYGEYEDFLNSNLLRGLPELFYGGYECSSFLAQTPEGDYILARNYDTTIALPFVLQTNSGVGYRTLGMADLNILGWNNSDLISKLTAISAPYFTFDGMNEHGVAIASLSVVDGSRSDIADGKTTLYNYAVNRLVIDKAKDVGDAIQQLSKYNIKMEDRFPSHYMIADASGHCAVIDYVDGKMQVVEMEGDYQLATNMLNYQNDQHRGYSSDRYRRFDKALSEKAGVISIDEAFELLEDNTTPGEAQWSCIYNLTDQTMSVEFYGDYDNTYTFRIK